ncbi:glycosyl transferase, family 8 [Fructilactobacillus florum 8D]|uniref:Glycosyl transferase, family 8 n=2 Tax=Fructilactobacillus florum TaxID=640331 RepID=W9EH64_9LACO|nr:glycosyltransferase family 8 protein [Fructilactobacillus florum]EKK20262.1 glycosyl transferase, family 8 [Fructilactobacillus florum 2F]ETO40606.1 glycosyl transferase, family 8 [Fructilactobacillus florum 8D]KRM91710.1 bifunctional glycosyl transferase family protein [Fructilactobacillus florum DSM 22689 = JCM 16035]
MLNIASVIDDKMALPLMTEYFSILENNPDVPITFNVVNDNLKKEHQKTLRALPRIFDNCVAVNFLRPTPANYIHANTSSPDSNIKRNAYYRIDIPEELAVDRIIYLDADLICERSLEALESISLGQHPIGAVEDQGYVHRLQEMGISNLPGAYFNSGVLVIDVARWNKLRISERTRSLANLQPEMLKYQDQDALNAVLKGDWQHLDPCYNVQTPLITAKVSHNPIEKRQLAENQALQSPTLIHFNRFDKPWIIRNDHLHPWRAAYYYYHERMINKLAAAI